jgi:hypothetical protein
MFSDNAAWCRYFDRKSLNSKSISAVLIVRLMQTHRELNRKGVPPEEKLASLRRGIEWAKQ